jgi:probable rRNA maturation factor
MRGSSPKPIITVCNRQRSIRVDTANLQDFAERVLEASFQLHVKKEDRISNVSELNVILVSDRRIAELHQRFMNLRGPTDVITFQHGEIFISVDMARRNGRRLGTSFGHEVRLYLTHGLLHLLGYDDKNPVAAIEMERVQERLIAAVLG